MFDFPQVYERSYLRTQREEYLLQQLQLEKQATEIAFHTINITNALSPDEYFERVSRPTLEDIFRNDPFGELNVCTYAKNIYSGQSGYFYDLY